VQFCFGIDTDGDGTWEYQPGFDLSGNSWLWNLTQGMDYSDLTKVSSQHGSIVAASEIVEFRMPLFGIGGPESMRIEPYLVIELKGQYVVADKANRFHIDIANNKLPRITNPLVPDAMTTPTTTASVPHTTPLTTVLETSQVPASVSQQSILTAGNLVMIFVAFAIITIVGAFYLRGRRR